MPTDGTDGKIEAIVFDAASEPWLAERTLRSLARRGLFGSVASEATLAARVAASARPVWLVRAGAWVKDVPSALLASPSRGVVAVGATAEDADWRDVLVDTGGDLGRARSWPRIDSVVALDPRSFGSLVAENKTVDLAAARASQRTRVVRVPSLDVGFQRSLRIVLTVTTLHRGGAERIVLDLTRELRLAGHDVVLTVLDRAARATFDPPAWTIHLAEHAGSRADRVALVRAIAEERGADVIHAHLLEGSEVAALTGGAIPVVVTVHNARPGWPGGLVASVLGAERGPLVVACSRGVEAELRASGVGRVRTVWNGITPLPPAATRAESREALGVAGEDPVVVAIANHRPQKRLDRLPAILAALRAQGTGARLLIAGEPVHRDAASTEVAEGIRAAAAAHRVDDHVRILGSVADPRALYAAADVIVSASAFEGLSLVHLEALAAGVPLVTTRVAGVDEIAAKHPAAVRIVEVDAPPEVFAAAIGGALERDARARPAALAPDFTSRRMAERHTDLYARATRIGRAETRSGLVLVTNNLSTGGAQSSARRLLTHLHRRGEHPVRVVVLEEQAAHPTPGRRALEAAGVPLTVAPRAGAFDPRITGRAVAQVIDEAASAAVLFWNVIPEHKVLIADLLFDVPVWDVSPGEMYFASFARYFGCPRVGSPYLDAREYGRLLTGAIVKYEAERDRAREVLGARVEVIPNGVVVPPRPLRRPTPPSGERIAVGTLARLSPDKKLEQLIAAVRFAEARAPGVLEVRIAGEADSRENAAYAAELRASAEGLPIAWIGEQAADDFLASLDVFAMVSEPSGCPNASLEALAAGLPIALTDHGGASEQVTHRETGLLVPRGDREALGEAILELASDPALRARLGDAAHHLAGERFSVERMAERYVEVCLAGITGS